MPESEAAAQERAARILKQQINEARRRGLALLFAAVAVCLLLLAMASTLSLKAALLATAVVGAAALVLDAVLSRYGKPPIAAPGPAAPPGELSGFPLGARALLDELPDALILIDAEGRIVGTNKAARLLFTGEHAERRYLSATLRQPVILQAVQRVRESGEAQEVELSDLVPVERHYKAFVRRVPDRDVPGLVVVVIHDLTEVKRIEQMRADFIANASHELRTPLSSLAGFIETLRGHARDDAKAREQFLKIMEEQARRMRRLIDDLLSLSRIELNEHVPPSGAVDLEAAAGEVVRAFQPLAREASAEIAVQAQAPLPLALGDRDEIVQVLQNLVDNAIKYGPPGNKVDILVGAGAPPDSGKLEGPSVYVSVRDRGQGIAREHIPRLTERFYRVDVKESRKRGGTGLGLAIVKHIVSRHRGKLVIKSELGQGSTFTVLLPAAEAAKAPPSPQREEPPRPAAQA